MAKVKRDTDNVSLFLEHDLDLDSRTLYLGSQISDEGEDLGLTPQVSERIIKGLHILNQQAPGGDKPITLIVNCPGGDVYNGLGILGAIENSTNPVHILVRGHAMSMAAWILQSGTRRVMDARSTLMLHYGDASYRGHSKGMKLWAKEEERLNDLMEKDLIRRIQEKNPKFKLKQLQKKIQQDWLITAEEAVDLGLADTVEYSSGGR